MNPPASLESVYTSLRDNTVIDEAIQIKMSPPLLMMPHKKWFDSKNRILVVGQETLGWKQKKANINSFSDFKRAQDSIATLQNAYANFCFARESRNHKNSPFWRAYRKIRESFDSSSEGIETNVLWTNLYKCSNDGKSWYGRNNQGDRNSIEKALQGILQQEINILKPTGIIFFTGPKYDGYLNKSISGNVIKSKIDDEYPTRQLAQLKVDQLPIPIFRTYHPNYLQRSTNNARKNWEVISLIIDALKQAAEFSENNLDR